MVEKDIKGYFKILVGKDTKSWGKDPSSKIQQQMAAYPIVAGCLLVSSQHASSILVPRNRTVGCRTAFGLVFQLDLPDVEQHSQIYMNILYGNI